MNSFWALLTPVIILGGIYAGIFTPTESAVVAIFYALFASKFIYHELTMKMVVDSIKDSVITNAICLFTIGLSLAFASYLTMQQIPMKVAGLILGLTSSPIVILLLINLFLLIVGCFIDNISSMTILTPILYPIVVNTCGVDPIHFGIFMTVNLAIGFITPPYGANLFVATGVTGLKIEEITTEIMPFLIGLFICLMLITYVPAISMMLPNFFYH